MFVTNRFYCVTEGEAGHGGSFLIVLHIFNVMMGFCIVSKLQVLAKPVFVYSLAMRREEL